MDFERLTRRELQTLCKKNKIPANITNVAMTQALKSLSFVEGIDEFMQPSQSETAHSSVESPERKEVTSPRIPPTGGGTTRRRTAVKEEPENLEPMTRTTRRSTRKTLDADDTQTPSVVKTTTRRARVNSVCRKMDSQLKECEEEEKRDSLVTPAPSGVGTRRRRGVKEESVVKREYSTRRSVRLAAKKVDVQDHKVDFFTKEGENVNVNIKESLDNVEETSGITGNTIVEKDFEQKEELEVVSAQKHYIQIGEGDDKAATVDTLEGIAESKNVQAEGHAHTGKEIEYEATFEEETVHKSEVDDQKLHGRSIGVNTAVDENLEENSEEEEELEVVLAKKHGIQIGEGDSAVTVHNLEGKVEVDDVQPEKNAHIDKEIEHEAAFEEETVQKSEVNDQKLDGRSIDVNTVMDENLEGNSEEDELEAVLSLKNYMQIGKEGDDNAATTDNLEGKGESEVVQAEERAYTSEQAATFEEETKQECEVDNQKLDEEIINVNTIMDKNSEVNDELEVDSVKELKTTFEEEGGGNFETYGLKGEAKEAKNVESETACFVFDTEVDVTVHNYENTVREGALDVCDLETETETSNEITEQSGFEERTCYVARNYEHETGDKSAVNFLVDTEMEKEISADKDMASKQLPPLNANEVVLEIQSNIAANMCGDVAKNEMNLGKSPKSNIVEAKEHENDGVYQARNSNEDVPTEISLAGSDSDVIMKPSCLTPYKFSATKASPKMKSLTIVLDNKENIDSGRKIILRKVSATEASPMMKRMSTISDNKVDIAKNTDGNDKKYEDVSMRKLAKMLQRKLQITNKLPKNENEKEVCGGRLVLKALSGNQLVEETITTK